ncbi:MAG: hemerythrin-like metal-binding domain protein [Herminiimonas sp.]|nr:hemerythrin-like metal-binding domain protein [Herminiimonas sp.]
MLLGYGPMDNTHREFVEIVAAMLAASDGDFAKHLDAFLAHAESHFGQERDWMAATNFPAMDCHVDEHNEVLKSVREVQAHLAAGGAVEAGRRLAQELVRWFPGHADYMDASLAQWMVKQRLGGTPVVLRRGVASNT